MNDVHIFKHLRVYVYTFVKILEPFPSMYINEALKNPFGNLEFLNWSVVDVVIRYNYVLLIHD